MEKLTKEQMKFIIGGDESIPGQSCEDACVTGPGDSGCNVGTTCQESVCPHDTTQKMNRCL